MDSNNDNKQSPAEGFEDSPDGDVLVDDLRITLPGIAQLDWRKDYSKERTRMCSGHGNG